MQFFFYFSRDFEFVSQDMEDMAHSRNIKQIYAGCCCICSSIRH